MSNNVVSQKRIEAYIDCVSPYSFYAFTYLFRNKKTLDALGVQVEFIPVFLGGINVGSGNKPPWTLPAKAVYSRYDGERAQRYFGMKFKIPSFFPIVSLLPQRCLVYVKRAHPERYEAFFDACFKTLWLNQKDISKPGNLKVALLNVFDEQEAEAIIRAADEPEIKQTLADNTTHAFKNLGAFGCPWFWVFDGKGNAEPFFGSDRFHFMWQYLELPHQGFELIPPTQVKL
ncbi:hypothetical protein M441DRAFT_28076 [Trichoderma asperellum CBS 433.97]|uniref:Glutathione S-transferase kappa n=1 Tax=Trichoderma asperellum (strain ATCC 204424 / CBS 433.97 / NBRC 101777) TaxID=1042311 RepID=A0A2T3Z5W5_TRIA4|nr:hypothetical protein M441DRAFT_28076 [Trichoderma asperellum CBS 433.97]PTB40216.1 hypothetical protein M441DRAFT_28076 [Trichoderma asperellum CBS 433.97]